MINSTPTSTANMLVMMAFTVIVFGLGVLYYNQIISRHNGTQNNAYIRVTNCILSTPPRIRSQKEIDICYERVEQDLNITLQRYNYLEVSKE